MKRLPVLLMACLFIPWSAVAETYRLRPDLTLTLPAVTAPWKVSTEPVAELVEHLAEHVVEEAAAKGKSLTAEQAREIALKRARHNQLFVVNQESGAHLLISVAPLEKGEEPPSATTVARSARYAAEGVADEGWEVLATRQAVTAITGAQLAQWFAIDYRHEGKPGLFMGIVGFADPYWFWFYATDHLSATSDRATLEKLMLGIEVRVGTP